MNDASEFTLKLFIQLVAIHVCFATFVYGIVGSLWGNLAEKNYHQRMRWRAWLMPGRLADKAYWTKRQKLLSVLMLPVVLLIYIGIMVSILKGSPAAP